MITEDTVKLIMTLYFKDKRIKAVSQKGPGPDFLHKGEAIETKGSHYPFDRAIQ